MEVKRITVTRKRTKQLKPYESESVELSLEADLQGEDYGQAIDHLYAVLKAKENQLLNLSD